MSTLDVNKDSVYQFGRVGNLFVIFFAKHHHLVKNVSLRARYRRKSKLLLHCTTRSGMWRCFPDDILFRSYLL